MAAVSLATADTRVRQI